MQSITDSGIGATVRKIRGERSQRQFSALIGVSHVAVGNWERGLDSPDDSTLIRLAMSDSKEASEFGLLCFLTRYPFILQILARRARQMPPQEELA